MLEALQPGQAPLPSIVSGRQAATERLSPQFVDSYPAWPISNFPLMGIDVNRGPMPANIQQVFADLQPHNAPRLVHVVQNRDQRFRQFNFTTEWLRLPDMSKTNLGIPFALHDDLHPEELHNI